MPNFVSVAPSVAELAHGKKSHTQVNQSVTHSTSLFDAPETEALALESQTEDAVLSYTSVVHFCQGYL